MSGSKKCPGCLNVFTSQTAHLSQTTNPLCRRIAKKRRSTRSQSVCVLRKQLPKSQTPPLPTSPAVSSQPNSPIPHPLPLLVSPLPTPPATSISGDISESSDDESDIFIDEVTPGWEPPVTGGNVSSNSSDEMEVDPPPFPTPPNTTRQRTWAAPKVVQFPRSRAGETIGLAPPSHDAYATSLQDRSPSNPYSPFVSKRDWEVAQWAKLHGPSSTSFGDLLKIDGVSHLDKNLFVLR